MTTPNSNTTEEKVCSVKNCRKKINDGEEVRISGQIFCRQCAVLMWKQTFA